MKLKEKHYPSAPMSETKISEYVNIEDGSNVILGIGPCRVGTKAQLFLMAASGYSSYEQPLKCVLRCSGHDVSPQPINFSSKVTYTKETLGPYSIQECEFDPVQVFRETAGINWMQERLNVIFLVRDPLDTWISWNNLWSDLFSIERLFDYFERSFENTLKILSRISKKDISYSIYDYSRNKNADAEYRILFNKIGLNNRPVTQNWKTDKIQGKLKSGVKYFKEPSVFLPEGIRETLKKSNGIHHKTYESSDVSYSGQVQRQVGSVYDRIISFAE